MSKRTSALVFERFACCPPGPPLRLNAHSSSPSGISSERPTRSTSSTPLRSHAMPGPPVVLVHGFATSAARTWGDNGWLDLLADVGRPTIAIDLLGHGTADKPHDPAAYAQLEALAAAQ